MFRGCYISNIDSNNIQQNCVKHVGLNALIYAHEHLTWTPKQLRHTLMVRFRFMIILDIRSPAAVFIDIYLYIHIWGFGFFGVWSIWMVKSVSAFGFAKCVVALPIVRIARCRLGDPFRAVPRQPVANQATSFFVRPNPLKPPGCYQLLVWFSKPFFKCVLSLGNS